MSRLTCGRSFWNSQWSTVFSELFYNSIYADVLFPPYSSDFSVRFTNTTICIICNDFWLHGTASFLQFRFVLVRSPGDMFHAYRGFELHHFCTNFACVVPCSFLRHAMRNWNLQFLSCSNTKSFIVACEVLSLHSHADAGQ